MSLSSALQDLGIDARAGEAADAIDGQVPGCVARPSDTSSVSALMRTAHRLGAITIVRGNGTKQTFGAPAPAADLVLDLSGMTGLLEHQPGDLIVRAEAGMPLRELQTHVSSAGQRLALDEPIAGSTLGGIVATNTSGARRLHAGTARDLLIGVTLVLADGTVARSGGKVVKNVAGYDLGKLLIGSYGTLAVITETTFRLHPVPAVAQWVVGQVSSDQLEPLLARLCHSQLAPSALEIDWLPGESATVAMLLEGTSEGIPGRVEAARAEFGIPTEVRDSLDWPWQLPAATDGSETLLKLTCRLGAIAEIASAATDLGLHVRGAAGTGVLYAASRDLDIAAVLPDLRARTADAGGACVIQTAPLATRRATDVWGPVSGMPIMRRLKQEFDPDHLLAPGRFVGGL